ncbi:MAG: lycopene cyclase domain-containing protein, partial [Bacteroidetes bacterium]
MNPHYTYLALDLGSILGPLLLSFDKKVAFYKRWPALFPAMLMTGVIFLVWDELFTRAGVWGFAPEYVTGVYIGSLPIEEVLFFLFVPYACMFVYECLNVYIKPDFWGKYARAIMVGLALLLIVVAALYLGHLYTSITFAGTAILLLVNAFFLRPSWWGRFFLAWMVCLIPFFIVNGVLTSLPVVWY